MPATDRMSCDRQTARFQLPIARDRHVLDGGSRAEVPQIVTRK
jgi:hypothetical protein